MEEMTILEVSTENFLTSMKELEKLFATTPKHKIKEELGIVKYERIVAILEYVNIRTTNIAQSLKDDIRGDLLEEKNSFFFTLKDDIKLKKQKEADENISKILELVEVSGVEIKRSSVITYSKPQEEKGAEEKISTNKILAQARKQLNKEEYLQLRDLFEKEGWISIVPDKDINLVEEALKTTGQQLISILDKSTES